jgi:hypothetical protein
VACAAFSWHLYEWNFLNGAQWEPWAGGDGRFSAGTFTLDSIQLFGRNNDAVVDLDLVAHNAFGSLAALLPNDSGRLVNASVRGTLTTVDPLLAVGLTVGAGTPATKPVLLRAAGPSLAALAVTGALPDPRLCPRRHEPRCRGARRAPSGRVRRACPGSQRHHRGRAPRNLRGAMKLDTFIR